MECRISHIEGYTKTIGYDTSYIELGAPRRHDEQGQNTTCILLATSPPDLPNWQRPIIAEQLGNAPVLPFAENLLEHCPRCRGTTLKTILF